jgi:hypothetical protein
MADNATLALNSGLCFFRAFFFISFAFLVGSKLHLSPWSEFLGPLQDAGCQNDCIAGRSAIVFLDILFHRSRRAEGASP